MKEFRFLSFFAAVTIVVATLNACANELTSSQSIEEKYAVLSMPDTDTFSGSYLAGRFAQRQQDWSAAEKYMGHVLEHDKDNKLLQQRAFLLSLGSGNHTKARALADQILLSGNENEIVVIFVAANEIAQGHYDSAIDYIKKLPDSGFGQYTKPLLTAWSLAGKGQTQAAVDILSKNMAVDDASYHLHTAIIKEMAQDMPGAALAYKEAMRAGLTLHSAVIVGHFFERYGQPEISKMIYTGLGKLYPFNPFISTISQLRTDGKNVPVDVSNVQEGAGLALLELATLLYEKHAYDSALIYTSIVDMLMPKSPFVSLLMGDIAATHKKYAEAEERYNTIPEQSPLYWLSRTRLSEIYGIQGRQDQAIGMLKTMSENPLLHVNALVALGDLYREKEDFKNAFDTYDRAIADLGELNEEHWPVIYARGISLERLNDWQKAEKDLLQALQFQPDNPMILNFIGYNWVTKGIHLDQALAYIKRAVDMRPDDGYILDSYGWAHYQMGNFEEAVHWMEKSAELVPDDPTILDHLGDAYWQAGRHDEARYRWLRASDISNDISFKTKLQGKIDSGLAHTPTKRQPVAQKEAKL